jgi:hypothetical protein
MPGQLLVPLILAAGPLAGHVLTAVLTRRTTTTTPARRAA